MLKQFQFPNGQVNYLDLSSGLIRSCGAKKLGTEYGYYSEEMEQYLSKAIEKPFSDLMIQINRFAEDGTHDLVMPGTVVETCKKYVIVSMARSQMALDTMMETSQIAHFLNDQVNHDWLVYFSTICKIELLPQLQTSKMLVLINRTSRQFVVPRNCFYYSVWHGLLCYIVPISPICALALVPEEYTGNIADGEECNLGIISDPDEVWALNLLALRVEYSINKSFVASASKEELRRLQKYVEDNRESLDALYSRES